MEIFRYAPHFIIEKLKVNKFMFILNFNICEKGEDINTSDIA